jgi:hypothetical protein
VKGASEFFSSNRSLRSLFQIPLPLPVQGEGKRAWRARVRAVSTQLLAYRKTFSQFMPHLARASFDIRLLN